MSRLLTYLRSSSTTGLLTAADGRGRHGDRRLHRYDCGNAPCHQAANLPANPPEEVISRNNAPSSQLSSLPSTSSRSRRHRCLHHQPTASSLSRYAVGGIICRHHVVIMTGCAICHNDNNVFVDVSLTASTKRHCCV